MQTLESKFLGYHITVLKDKVVVELDGQATGEEGTRESDIQESQSGGAFVPMGSCPVFHTKLIPQWNTNSWLCLDQSLSGSLDSGH